MARAVGQRQVDAQIGPLLEIKDREAIAGKWRSSSRGQIEEWMNVARRQQCGCEQHQDECEQEAARETGSFFARQEHGSASNMKVEGRPET